MSKYSSAKVSEFAYSQSLVESLRKAFPNISVSTIIEVVKAHKNELDACLTELTCITESREPKKSNVNPSPPKQPAFVFPSPEIPQILAPLPPQKNKWELKKEKKLLKTQAKQKKKMEKLSKKMNLDLSVTDNAQYLIQKLDKVIAESEHDGEKIASRSQVKMLVLERMQAEQEKQKALKWAIEELQKARALIDEKEKKIVDLKEQLDKSSK